jgi:hypothetical protein
MKGAEASMEKLVNKVEEVEVKVYSQEELEGALKRGEYPLLCGDGKFYVRDSSQVTACDSSQVRACNSSQVRAYGSSQVTAYGSSQVTAYGSSQVRAYDSSQVRAYDSSQVRACNSSQVRAYGSSQVTACDSSQVRACNSSQVRAYGSSQVTACDSSQVRATPHVAVTIHGHPTVRGGVKIRPKNPSDVGEWLEYFDVRVTRGVAILYKAVGDDFKSAYGTSYAPGSTPSAADWDGGKAECGGGLHFCPCPVLALTFNQDATRFVGCPVRVDEIAFRKNASYPTKVKAPRVCAPVWECDINGNRIEKDGKHGEAGEQS